jgi:hypothetical protein
MTFKIGKNFLEGMETFLWEMGFEGHQNISKQYVE